MLYNLDHPEDIDQCVRVSSTIRILPDMWVCVLMVERGYMIMDYNGHSHIQVVH